jgi:hypothetical protein
MGTTQVVSADIGLSMKQVGRSGIAERDSVVAEDYEQCQSICVSTQCHQHTQGCIDICGSDIQGNQFGPDAQGLAAGSPLPNLVVASSATETAAVSQATSTQTLQSRPSKSACRRKQKKHTKKPTNPAQTASTTGIVEAVQPSITSSSTALSSSGEPTSTFVQPASAIISSTAPEVTQSSPSTGGNGSSGVGGPDRSKPEDWLKAHNDERAKYGQSSHPRIRDRVDYRPSKD